MVSRLITPRLAFGSLAVIICHLSPVILGSIPFCPELVSPAYPANQPSITLQTPSSPVYGSSALLSFCAIVILSNPLSRDTTLVPQSQLDKKTKRRDTIKAQKGKEKKIKLNNNGPSLSLLRLWERRTKKKNPKKTSLTGPASAYHSPLSATRYVFRIRQRREPVHSSETYQ
ncbi:hypothetical protein PDE_03507 [Penicillium oxalicum 114-2]|uniref:Uncharacterized protein n=1 Tax=Penicillium oxalicum (strain 114-2 / CGMCC 5302) TaxID=933388 RepID=S7ZIP1_PENO1|nr:hypothetical protein PDE_03507 [Penicillium oxalicum 114-2]